MLFYSYITFAKPALLLFAILIWVAVIDGKYHIEIFGINENIVDGVSALLLAKNGIHSS